MSYENQKDKFCCGGCAITTSISKVDNILAKYVDIEESLISILQEIQNKYRYLPKNVLQYISQKTGIPISKIYGVVTFYSQFHLKPRGKHVIRVCQGTACHIRGGKIILKKLEELLNIKAGQTTQDLKFTLETVACIGACGLAPVMMINDDTYGRLELEKLFEIIQKY